MDDDVRAELLAMRERDLVARQAIAEAMRVRGADQVDAALIEAGLATENANAERLAAIIETDGWPSVVQVGMDGVEAAWHIALHAEADLDLQRRCLGLVTEAVAAGEPSPDRLAALTDRVLVADGRPQRFGTQFVTAAHGLRLVEIDDPEGLEARRHAVGLPPLGDQLDRLRSDLEQ